MIFLFFPLQFYSAFNNNLGLKRCISSIPSQAILLFDTDQGKHHYLPQNQPLLDTNPLLLR